MKKKILIALIVVVILGLFCLCFWCGTRIKKPIPIVENKIDKAINFEKTEEQQKSSMVVPKSNKKAFPFVTKDLSQTTEPNSQTYKKLFLWTLNENKMIDTGIKVFATGFWAKYGNNYPIASPNRLYTAYVDIENKKLNIISHETLEKVVVSDAGVEYISGWSPDNNKIVYYIQGYNLETAKTQVDMMGGPDWTANEKFSENVLPGFYMFDLVTGKTKYLYPLTSFDSFIDSKRILSIVEYEDVDKKVHDKLVIFDTETFEADYSTFKVDIGPNILQFDYSKDLSKWTYSYRSWQDNPSKVEVRLANWPEIFGEKINIEDWSQSPSFSPDGTKIAYSSGSSIGSIYLYDIQTKSNSRLTEGRHSYWMDDKNLMIHVVGQNNEVKYNVINIDTKELKPIPLIE